jgi:hypothetical protein
MRDSPRPKSGLTHRSKEHPYSITLSARASSVAGTSMPSVLAALKWCERDGKI